jgi:hypothetical protein
VYAGPPILVTLSQVPSVAILEACPLPSPRFPYKAAFPRPLPLRPPPSGAHTNLGQQQVSGATNQAVRTWPCRLARERCALAAEASSVRCIPPQAPGEQEGSPPAAADPGPSGPQPQDPAPLPPPAVQPALRRPAPRARLGELHPRAEPAASLPPGSPPGPRAPRAAPPPGPHHEHISRRCRLPRCRRDSSLYRLSCECARGRVLCSPRLWSSQQIRRVARVMPCRLRSSQ